MYARTAALAPSSRRWRPVVLALLVSSSTCRPPDLTASGGCGPWAEGVLARRVALRDVAPRDAAVLDQDAHATVSDAQRPPVPELPPLRVRVALRPGSAGTEAEPLPRGEIFFSQLAAALAAQPLFEPDPEVERLAEAAARAAVRTRDQDVETSGPSTGLEPFLVATVGILRPAAGAPVAEPTYVIGLTLAIRRTLQRRALDAPPAIHWRFDLPARALQSERLLAIVAQAVEARAQVEIDREVGAARELLADPLLSSRTETAEALFFALGPTVYADLVDALDADRPEERAVASRVLARAGDPDLSKVYLWMHQAEDPEMRLAGLEGLWRLSTGQFPPHLGKIDGGIPTPEHAWIVALGRTACRFEDAVTADSPPAGPHRTVLEDQTDALRRHLADRDLGVARAALVLLTEYGDADTPRHIRDALGGAEDPERKNLLWLALGRLGDRDVLPRIRRLATGSDPLTTVAVLTAARLGDRTVTGRVKTLLAHDDPRVRCAAAEALAQVGDPSLATDLVPLLSNSQPAPVVRAAQGALVAIGEGVIPTLVEALDSAEPSVAWAAAEALGSIGSAAAVAPLCAKLVGLDGVLRDYIVDALRRIGDVRAMPALVAAFGGTPSYRNDAPILRAILSFGRRAIPALLDGLASEDPAVRAGALEALVRLGDTDHAGVVRQRLADSDPEVRRRAARYFTVARDPQAVELLAALLRDPDETVAATAAEALGAQDDPRSRGALPEAVADSRGVVAAAAARSLARLGDLASVGTVLEAGARLSGYDRSRIVDALVAYGPGAREALLGALACDRLRPVALEALDGLDVSVPLEALGPHRNDPRSTVREIVARLLGRSGEQAAAALLGEMLLDASAAVREAAVGALVEVGGPQAVDLLRGALGEEKDEWVARAIRRALIHLGSTP